jgi:uncharacterized protein
MAIINSEIEDYKPPLWQWNKHIQTIYPSVFRKVTVGTQFQESEFRIPTKDGDFLVLDHLFDMKNRSESVVIICHGLEGDKYRAYVRGMAKICLEENHSVLTWNYRGCGGIMNDKPIFYHSGATYDLEEVIMQAMEMKYKKIHLIGFSLGGNLVLKYLGEKGEGIAHQIVGGIGISVPMHLESGCKKISHGFNKLYSLRFLKTLKHKIREKAKIFPDEIDPSLLDEIHDLATFDDIYTSKLHGFDNAHHYYESCSSLYFLGGIRRPTCIISAINDPFLSEKCLPEKIDNSRIKTIYTQQGGHVGFYSPTSDNASWLEKNVMKIIRNW